MTLLIWKGNFAFVPDMGKRFIIRRSNAGPFSDIYHVVDAETVSDAQVRAGIKPLTVAEFGTEDEALAWCKAAVYDRTHFAFRSLYDACVAGENLADAFDRAEKILDSSCP